MVPLELWQVANVPDVVVVAAALFATNNGIVQGKGAGARLSLVQKLDPALDKVATAVVLVLFATQRRPLI